MTRGIAVCPRCDRTVPTAAGRYEIHAMTRQSRQTCPLSLHIPPIEGLSDRDWEARAYLVADLGEHVQDADPATVWTYLTALPAVEVQRLLMVALAGLPVDKKVDDIFDWVWWLPVAQEEAS